MPISAGQSILGQYLLFSSLFASPKCCRQSQQGLSLGVYAEKKRVERERRLKYSGEKGGLGVSLTSASQCHEDNLVMLPT